MNLPRYLPIISQSHYLSRQSWQVNDQLSSKSVLYDENIFVDYFGIGSVQEKI